jgi:hypothetical protein
VEHACRCRLRYPLQSTSGSRRASGSKRSSVSCRKHLYSLPRGVVAPFFFLQSPSCNTSNLTNYLGFATGSQALYLGFTLRQKTRVSISIQTITSPSTLVFPPQQISTRKSTRDIQMTHVEYGLYAARLSVGFTRCSFNSHSLIPGRMIGSAVGARSTM